MKTRYLLSLLTAIFFHLTESNAQIVNIPDAQFKAALLTHTPTLDSNNDGEIQLTEAESYSYTINVNNQGIADLTGIEAFSNINAIEARQNNLTSVELSKNTQLKKLSLSNNQLTTIDLSENLLLEHVWIHNNQLSSLDLSSHTLLTNINLLNNNLETLDVSNSPNLTHLVLADNHIREIDLTNNILIKQLYLQENELTSLSLTSQSELESLALYDNQITQIDLTNNTALKSLNLSRNPLSGHLDLSNQSSIDYLIISNTQLESLNIANGSNVNIRFFNAPSNPQLTCIQVDDVAYATYNFTFVDPHVSFSLTCNPITVVDRQLFECVDLGTIATASLSDESLTAEVDFTLGDVFLYKTNRGRYGKLLITSQNTEGDITLYWVTYSYDGSIYSEGQLDVVYAVDLDRGTSQTIPTGSEDFIWSGNRLSPKNEALFSVYKGIVEIPDQNFKNVLLNHIPIIDINGDNEIQLCEAKAFDGPIHADDARIFDLRGVEAFTKIHYLNVSKNVISRANLDWNHSLKYLDFSSNSIMFLDVRKNTQLINLDCSNNRIVSLNLKENTTLQSLICSNNQLQSLDLSENDSLYVLYVDKNSLTQLDITHNPLLHTLDASYNRLESIDLSQNSKLKKVTLKDNQIRGINVTNQPIINSLLVSDNKIEKLNLSQNPEILWLDASDNNLVTITFPSNKPLYEINVSNNRLRSLDVTDFSILTKLNVERNQLTEISITGSLSLEHFNIKSNRLSGSIDLSGHLKLRTFWASENNFSEMNIANGANHLISNPYHFDVRANPNLFCIQVDDVQYAESVYTNKDSHTSFSTNCSKSKSHIASSISIENHGQEVIFNDVISVFPNPSTDVLYIKADEHVSISLTDINGKVMLVSSGSNLRLNIQSLKPGIYMINISNENMTYNHKIIKAK